MLALLVQHVTGTARKCNTWVQESLTQLPQFEKVRNAQVEHGNVRMPTLLLLLTLTTLTTLKNLTTVNNTRIF